MADSGFGRVGMVTSIHGFNFRRTTVVILSSPDGYPAVNGCVFIHPNI